MTRFVPAYGLIILPLLMVTRAQFECGDCLTVRNLPGCTVQEVSDCVCAADPFCCISTWSSFCIGEVFTFNCDQFCPVDEVSSSTMGGQLSGGWIFTIIVVSVLGAYFVLGFLFNWCCRTDSNQVFPECIPQYRVWKEVPGLVRDGWRLVSGKLQSV